MNFNKLLMAMIAVLGTSMVNANIWLVNQTPFKIRFNMEWNTSTLWWNRDGGLGGHSSLWQDRNSGDAEKVWNTDFRVELDPKGSAWDQAQVEGDVSSNKTRYQVWVNETGSDDGWTANPQIDMQVNEGGWRKVVISNSYDDKGNFVYALNTALIVPADIPSNVRNEAPLAKYPAYSSREANERLKRVTYQDKK